MTDVSELMNFIENGEDAPQEINQESEQEIEQDAPQELNQDVFQDDGNLLSSTQDISFPAERYEPSVSPTCLEVKDGVFTLIVKSLTGIVTDITSFNLSLDIFSKDNRLKGLGYVTVLILLYIVFADTG